MPRTLYGSRLGRASTEFISLSFSILAFRCLKKMITCLKAIAVPNKIRMVFGKFI